MSDIRCSVCRTPWDSYGVRECSDMMRWEAALLRQGAGCPCCCGVVEDQVREDQSGNRVHVMRAEDAPGGYARFELVQIPCIPYGPCKADEVAQEYPIFVSDVDGGAAEAHARSVIMGDDEGDEDWQAIEVLEARPARPPWKRPEDPVLFACEGCGSAVVRDLDWSKVQISRGVIDTHRTFIEGIAWRAETTASRRDEAYHSDEWDEVLRDTIKERDLRAMSALRAPRRPGDKPPKGDDLQPPVERLIDGKFYCTACAVCCAHCDELTLTDETRLPEGRYDRHDGVCGSCYEKIPTCSDCGTEWNSEEQALTCCEPEGDEDSEEDGGLMLSSGQAALSSFGDATQFCVAYGSLDVAVGRAVQIASLPGVVGSVIGWQGSLSEGPMLEVRHERGTQLYNLDELTILPAEGVDGAPA